MATDDTEILVAQLARVYLGAVGTAAPADETATLDANWKEVGFFTPDSLQLSDTPTFASVVSHQSAYPTRQFQTGQAAAVQVDLQQFNGDNLIGVMGGGTIVTIGTSGTHFKYSPPQIGGRDYIAALIELTDGTKKYRFIIPKAIQTEANTMQFRRTNETTLPLRLAVQGSDVGDPWYLLTNDPAFDPS